MPTRILRGDAARQIVNSQLAAHLAGIRTDLERYDRTSALRGWHHTIRCIEEFINVPKFGVPDNGMREWLHGIRIDEDFPENPFPTVLAVRRALEPYLDADVTWRFARMMLYCGQIGTARSKLEREGRLPPAALSTIGEAADYFQSRRRHIVSIFYAMSEVCTGSRTLNDDLWLSELLTTIERSCIAVTGFQHKLVLIDCIPEFSLAVDEHGAMASHRYDNLDESFLEAERASIHVMDQVRGDAIKRPELERLDRRKIFSAAELRNSIRLIGATYDAFGPLDSDFRSMSLLAIAFSRHCRDGYFIEIDRNRFRSMLRAQEAVDPDEAERLLVNRTKGYIEASNAYEPFVEIGDSLVSNVNLLSRFLYGFKNVHLQSRRRFAIHAGFIFEDLVKRDLAAMGFRVTDIKRIDRKEFDVVAFDGDVVYNLQCKNNWIDLTKIDSEPTLFVRYNRRLVRYYERALEKERRREDLIKRRLGCERVVNVVISRFPVITTNPAIVNHNRIKELRQAAR